MHTIHRLCRICIEHNLPQVNILRGPEGFGFTIYSDCPVRVQDVDPEGPANAAGLCPGDAVLQLNGVSVETWGCGQLAHAIRSCPVHISLVVWRLSHEATPDTWSCPNLPQEEKKNKLLSGPANRRRGQKSLWRRSQDQDSNPALSLHYTNLSQSREGPNPTLTRTRYTGLSGEDYIVLSPIDHSLTSNRATTMGRWYRPSAPSQRLYSSVTLPTPTVATTPYSNYENCTIVQSHNCSSDPGSIAPRTLIFPINLKPLDLNSPGRTLLMSEDLILHQPDLLPAKVTVLVYNDLLLFTKEDKIGRYNVLQSPVYLNTISLFEVCSRPLHLFFLRTTPGSVQFGLESYSLQQKYHLSICLHDNMQQLVAMETQRLSLHDNTRPLATETEQLRDLPSDLDPLALPRGFPPVLGSSFSYSQVHSPIQTPVHSLACSPVWKPRYLDEERQQAEGESASETSEGRRLRVSPVCSDREGDSDEEELKLSSSSGLSRSLSEGSLLHAPRSPHFISDRILHGLTWPLRTSPAPEDWTMSQDYVHTTQPSLLTLKKHLQEGGSLQRILELLYGKKAVELGNTQQKRRTSTLVSLAFLRRRKNNPSFNSNSLKKALKNNRPPPDQVQKWSESLEALLTNQYGVAVFRHFLRSEFSDENLDFWLAVERYKRTCPQKMVAKATKIYNEFISNNAPRQVNIDSGVREITNQSLSLGISPSSFHLAQDQIYGLMLSDSYPRFLKSSLYTQLDNQSQKKL